MTGSMRLAAIALGLLFPLLPHASDFVGRVHALELPEGASGLAPKPLVKAKKHMVVAANPLAAED